MTDQEDCHFLQETTVIDWNKVQHSLMRMEYVLAQIETKLRDDHPIAGEADDLLATVAAYLRLIDETPE
ncbi:MAG: hypothetical protein V4443_07230 [Pseudomonadota bacterium]